MHLKSGTGAVAGMTLVGALSAVTELPLLLAPFGASAVLLFGQPSSPLAQPINVFGGYAIAAAISAAISSYLPGIWWVAAIAVGLVVALMLLLRVTHPPAGAVPLVAFGSSIAPPTLFGVVLAGSACLILVAVLHHLVPPRQDYPRRVDQT